jgi:hypothetical protein
MMCHECEMIARDLREAPAELGRPEASRAVDALREGMRRSCSG